MAPEELEADFQRVYNIDLLDLYRGTLSIRKASALAANLPAGSQVWIKLGGPLAWTPEVTMASMVEWNTSVLIWLKTKAAQRPGAKPPPPMSPPKDSLSANAHEAQAKRALAAYKRRLARREKRLEEL